MTPNERALLLAVAKRLTTQLDYYGGDTYRALVDAIAAVEAEAENTVNTYGKTTLHGAYAISEILGRVTQPETCPVCKGTGMTVFNACQDMCWVCDGTGRKK